jgi:hypothetical protein
MSESAEPAQEMRVNYGPGKRRTMPPAALNLLHPTTRKTETHNGLGHRRYKSSPAALNFKWKHDDQEAIPPVPKLPLSLKGGASTMKLAM